MVPDPISTSEPRGCMAQEEDYDVPSPEKFMPAGKSYNEARLAAGSPTMKLMALEMEVFCALRCCNNNCLNRNELKNHRSNDLSETETGWNMHVLMCCCCPKIGCQKLVTQSTFQSAVQKTNTLSILSPWYHNR